MKDAVIVSQQGMGSGDEELGTLLLRRYLRQDLVDGDRAARYVFYNAGIGRKDRDFSFVQPRESP